MHRYIFWGIIFISIALFSAYQNRDADSQQLDKEITGLIRGSVSQKYFKTPIKHFKLYDKGNKLIGFVVKTTEAEPKVYGYGGEIEILIGVGLDGKVTGLRLLPHMESSEYMAIVEKSGLLKRMVGLDAGDITKLDAVTSATASSSAVIEDVARAVGEVQTRLIPDLKKTLLKSEGGDLSTDLFVLLPIVLGSIAAFFPKKKSFKVAALVVSFLVVGIFLNRPITIGNILDMPAGSFFNPANWALVLIFVVSVIMALFKGPFYCTFICPFGAAQEGLSKVLKSDFMPGTRLSKIIPVIRYLLTFIVAVAVVFFGLQYFKMIEPFALSFSRWAPIQSYIQAGVILLFALFFRRIWCRNFCPTGLFMELFDRIGFRIRRLLKR